MDYDTASWRSIARQLAEGHAAVPAVTRAQLLDDAYHLFLEGSECTICSWKAVSQTNAYHLVPSVCRTNASCVKDVGYTNV